MNRDIVKSRLALRVPSAKATEDDLELAQDLLDTLAAHANECVGLAANMVGFPKRIIAFDDEGTPRVMLNPQITAQEGSYHASEGCLSLPGRRAAIRYRNIVVRWQDTSMNWHEDSFSGRTAQIIQHEVDHCNGILI